VVTTDCFGGAVVALGLESPSPSLPQALAIIAKPSSSAMRTRTRFNMIGSSSIQTIGSHAPDLPRTYPSTGITKAHPKV